MFPNQFAHISGLDSTMIGKPIGNEENMFKFNVNLHHNFRSLYVYSDIASFTFIGDTVAPLLRIAPSSHNSKTGYVYKEFKTLHYVSVSKSDVDQVHITIKTENGSVVPFVTGKTILKLHFRRKKNSINTSLVCHFCTNCYKDEFFRGADQTILQDNGGI